MSAKYTPSTLSAIHLLLIYSEIVYYLFMIQPFGFDDYRAYIRARVETEDSPWGLWARLAKSAGCKATYLSQAMHEKVHLTADHVAGIAKFWRLDSDETQFLLLLLERQRAATPTLKDFLQKQIDGMRRRRQDLSERFARPEPVAGEKEVLYFSAWYWSAIQSATRNTKFQTPAQLARKFHLSQEMVEHCLVELEKHGFVRKKQNGDWEGLQPDIHLSKISPLIGMHHSNWRNRAALDWQSANPESIHFTAVYSMSRKDADDLKEKITELIVQSRQVALNSSDEEVVVFTTDFFLL